MEKFKATKKQFVNQEVYRLGFCDAHDLFIDLNPVAYSAGINGWDCDYYQIDDVYISTGYRAIGKQVDYKIIEKYEKKVAKLRPIQNEKEKKAKRAKLLAKFIEEIRK